MATFRNILIADDEPSIRHVLSLVLSERGYEARSVSNGEEALQELAAHCYEVLITDVRMPRLDGLTLLKQALARWPDLYVIVTSAYGSTATALEAVAAGAYDYVQKPFKPDEMVLVLRKAEERARLLSENRRLKRNPRESAEPLDRILGTSEPVAQLKRQITKLAPVSTTVLFTGESGTGKEVAARALHDLSSRSAMPFVAVNCGAIPATLIESELFGHARGAFTDAKTNKRGLFSEADGGSIFLDEIGELPMQAQVKLLRVLQEGEVRPIGENKSEKVDVRVIAATLRDLGKLVERGEFREDLYYRLNVVNVRVPPLRTRAEDIIPLAVAFVARFNRELNRERPVTGFTPEAESLLASYPWPGNVRELENAMERAVLMTDETLIAPDALPEKLWTQPAKERPASALPETAELSLKRAVREMEQTFIRAALKRTGGNRTRAAVLLEISHRALLYKIKEYGIDPDA